MRILFATDGSEESGSARVLLEAIPLPPETRIRVLSVLSDPWPLVGPYPEGAFLYTDTLAQIRERERELAEAALRRAAGRLGREGVEVDTLLREGDPPREIVAAAEEFEADLVAVGSRGLTGLDRLLLGSVAREVTRRCRRPVLVGRAARGDLRAAVVATDGSEHARHAVAFASRLSLPAWTRLSVVHVYRPYSPFPGLFPTDREQFEDAVREVREKQRGEAEALAAAARDQLRKGGREVEAEIREGDPAEEILALVEEREADLIVLGARGASLLEGLVMGSVADRILKEAACSVLVVP